MKMQVTTEDLTRVILCILALLSSSLQAGSFLDDFSDGDIQDGSPATWQWDPGKGQCAVTGGGLELTSQTSWPSLLMLRAADEQGLPLCCEGNISIRAQLNLGREWTATALLGVVTPDFQLDSNRGGYFLGFNRAWLFLSRDDTYCPVHWHAGTTGRFDPAEDVIVQLDLIRIRDDAGNRIESRLECRWWLPGQEMPEQAMIVGVDSVYDVTGVILAAGTSSIPGSQDNPTVFRWVEVITDDPVVDFTGDGTVDIKDLERFIESWGQNDPLMDLVPDGIVDKQDLEILMKYWQQDVIDPTLLAHWALDEAEGDVAGDSAGSADGLLIGAPTWRPEAGIVGGALQLDGDNDCVVVDSGLDPAEGPFTVLAWVKGGAPGQVMLSQAEGQNWLMVDAMSGALATALAPTGRYTIPPLVSEAVIAADDWHRIAVTCDGVSRILYADSLLVAEDFQPAPTSCLGDLNIGTGQNHSPGTFFGGLIDDLRIYNRLVRP